MKKIDGGSEMAAAARAGLCDPMPCNEAMRVCDQGSCADGCAPAGPAGMTETCGAEACGDGQGCGEATNVACDPSGPTCENDMGCNPCGQGCETAGEQDGCGGGQACGGM